MKLIYTCLLLLSLTTFTFTHAGNQQIKNITKTVNLTQERFTLAFPQSGQELALTFNELPKEQNINLAYIEDGVFQTAQFKSTDKSITFDPRKTIKIPLKLIQSNQTKTIYFNFFKIGADYSSEYIQKNHDTINIHTPEIFELIHVAIALTDYSTNSLQNNNYLIRKNTQYYQKLNEYFKNFKTHDLVKMLNTELNQDSGNYFVYQQNSYSLIANDLGFVEDNNTYTFFRKDKLTEINHLINDFYQDTKFNRFYNKHKMYYSSLNQIFLEKLALKKMHNWLEKISGIKYNSIKYITSPLVFGSHSTVGFDDGHDFKEILCFIPVMEHDSYDINPESFTFDLPLFQGVIFTEIDHNFVNPVTEKYSQRITDTMSNIEHYNTKSNQGHYATQLLTFNEYLTHTLFLVYAKENFKTEDYQRIKSSWAQRESNPKGRGFIKFSSFYDELQRIYDLDPKSFTVDEATRSLIKWINAGA